MYVLRWARCTVSSTVPTLRTASSSCSQLELPASTTKNQIFPLRGPLQGNASLLAQYRSRPCTCSRARFRWPRPPACDAETLTARIARCITRHNSHCASHWARSLPQTFHRAESKRLFFVLRLIPLGCCQSTDTLLLAQYFGAKPVGAARCSIGTGVIQCTLPGRPVHRPRQDALRSPLYSAVISLQVTGGLR